MLGFYILSELHDRNGDLIQSQEKADINIPPLPPCDEVLGLTAYLAAW